MLFKKYTLSILVFIATFSCFSYASDNKPSPHGYAVDYIQGEGDVKGIKLAYQYHPEFIYAI